MPENNQNNNQEDSDKKDFTSNDSNISSGNQDAPNDLVLFPLDENNYTPPQIGRAHV